MVLKKNFIIFLSRYFFLLSDSRDKGGRDSYNVWVDECVYTLLVRVNNKKKKMRK